jgi:hypothetical protein
MRNDTAHYVKQHIPPRSRRMFCARVLHPESRGGAESREPPPRGHGPQFCVNTRELRVVITRVFNEIISREPTREIGVEVDLGMRTPLLQIGF